MKKIIFFYFLILSVSNGHAQCSDSYKSLKEFSNDTTAFLMYNFRDRSECYNNQTLENIIQDIEIPIKDFMVIGNTLNANNAIGIYIYFYPRGEASRMIDNKQEPHTIEIIWDYELNFKEALRESRRNPREKWNKRAYNYFKGMHIKEIRTVIYEYSNYYSKYYSKPNYEN